MSDLLIALKRRALSALDAASQLLNVLLLPRAGDTNANESICGRCWREGTLEGRGGAWLSAQRVIDRVARRLGEDEHCKKSYLADLRRAAYYVRRNRRYLRGRRGQ